MIVMETVALNQPKLGLKMSFRRKPRPVHIHYVRVRRATFFVADRRSFYVELERISEINRRQTEKRGAWATTQQSVKQGYTQHTEPCSHDSLCARGLGKTVPLTPQPYQCSDMKTQATPQNPPQKARGKYV
jgi:hypothetical protein